MVSAVTFDAGQTLVELDLDFLSTRLTERGLAVAVSALESALPASWRRYDEVIAGGAGHPWRALVTELLAGAGVERELEATVDWLWTEQPRRNLWRRAIPDMVGLARELAARGVIVGVLSNSEGRIAELLTEVGIADPFHAIIDSGRVGFEKPDPRIFAYAAAQLGVSEAIHIGDSWAADVQGALAAGWRAIWFHPRANEGAAEPRVAFARDAAEARAALAAFGV